MLSIVVRLMNFFDPLSASRWVVSLNSEAKRSIILEYKITQQDANYKKFNETELQEFQTKIVLAETKGLGVNAYLNNFIEQFDCMTQIGNTFTNLLQAGHFLYRKEEDLRKMFTLVTNIDHMRSYRSLISKQLSDWKECIQESREKFYIMNIFDISFFLQAYDLILQWDGKSLTDEVMGLFENLIFNLMLQINIDTSYDAKMINILCRRFLECLINDPKAIHTVKDVNVNPENKLTVIAIVLNSIFEDVPSRRRELTLSQEDMHLCGLTDAATARGSDNRRVVADYLRVHMTGSEGVSKGALIKEVLSTFARERVLPEYETSLICSKSTTVDQVSIFTYSRERLLIIAAIISVIQ
jgi:hypothetical protein